MHPVQNNNSNGSDVQNLIAFAEFHHAKKCLYIFEKRGAKRQKIAAAPLLTDIYSLSLRRGQERLRLVRLPDIDFVL